MATLARRSDTPTNPVRTLQDAVDELFEDFSTRVHFADWPQVPWRIQGTSVDFSPAVDVEETKNSYILTAEVPGMDPKDIDIDCDGKMLRLSGEKRTEHKEDKKNWHLVERNYGSFSRTMALPREVDSANIKASYKNGILTVNMPKTAAAKEHYKKIAIKAD